MNHTLSSGLPIALVGEQFTAFAERALYWHQQRLLMIADLHLGKSDIFRAAGIAVPYAVQSQDLNRLHTLLEHLQPTTLVVLGDLLHGTTVAPQTMQAWHTLRNQHPATRFVLTQGNHDRHIQAYPSLVDEIQAGLNVDGIWLSHEPYHQQRPTYRLNINGHQHPVFRPRAWRRSLPAMVYNHKELVLPAFSEFTAGMPIHQPTSQVWIFSSPTDVVQVQ